jgi:hypothetical protein
VDNQVGDQLVQDKRATQGKGPRAEVKVLREKLRSLDKEVERLRRLIEDRTYRLARRVAQLEGASPAVQCQDGS